LPSPILDGLNEQQRAAVTAPDGPVLVLAGPGSGKTRVLTRRIAYLVSERGVPEWRIMAVTFTNKAAREMRRRVEGLLGGDLRGLTMGTFHAICARILRREAEAHLPLTRDFVIFDASDQRALMKVVITDDLNLDDKRYEPRRILGRISNAKNDLITPAEFHPHDYFDEIVKRAYEAYQQRLAVNNAVDFDDLLMHTALLFARDQGVLIRYQNQFDHLLVDEFQDTNGAQYTLLKLLADRSKNLFCVGDEDQSIYRWRGADYRNLNRLRIDFPGLHTVLLEQNYRSTQIILDAARAVIDQNPQRTPKELFTERGEGPQIILYEAHDEAYEAQFVVDQIALLVQSGEAEPGECAVMYRTNAQSRALEDAFVRANLPYRLVGATRFYARREIKDVIAYLRVIHNPDDRISLMRVINTPPRGIGDVTVQALEDWAAREGITPGEALLKLHADPETAPLDGRAGKALGRFAEMLAGWRGVQDTLTVADLMKMVLDETGYLEAVDDGTDQGVERRENVMELANVAAEFEELPLSTFLEEVALVSDVDDLETDVNAPSLLTLHSAKGLEFDAVFLVGLEDGMLPHQRSLDDPEQMAEERRLMYVGMTRARKWLFLVHAFRRAVWGESNLNLRSRFIDDIPADLIVPAHAAALGTPGVGGRRAGRPPRVERAARGRGAQSELHAGARVRHEKFGEGIVIETRERGDDQEVSVAFEGAGLKRLLASFANLKVLDG
jgi:DNA helicase-2/ATP-dependent DNA helicase PcrA